MQLWMVALAVGGEQPGQPACDVVYAQVIQAAQVAVAAAHAAQVVAQVAPIPVALAPDDGNAAHDPQPDPAIEIGDEYEFSITFGMAQSGNVLPINKTTLGLMAVELSSHR